MNDDNPYGLPNFGHPTETLLRQLVNAATARLSVPLRLIGLRLAERSTASAEEGKVTLEVNSTTLPYTLAARGRIKSRDDVRAIVAKGAIADLPILLTTTYLTPALANECVEQDLQFIDLAGNPYVHAPGQYIFVTGRPASPDIKRLASRSGKPAGSASVSALRMIFVLLSAPELVNRPYREIASSAGVAFGRRVRETVWLCEAIRLRAQVFGRMPARVQCSLNRGCRVGRLRRMRAAFTLFVNVNCPKRDGSDARLVASLRQTCAVSGGAVSTGAVAPGPCAAPCR